jgi:hypothetical protein
MQVLTRSQNAAAFPDEEAPEALIGGKGIGRAYVTASEFAKA